MNYRPPVSTLCQELPFRDSAFSWPTFEDFFCDFLNARPPISFPDRGTEVRGSIIRARPFGRPGDVQFGIDLLAEMEGGEEWDFQCKHVASWTPGETERAIAKYRRDGARRFLLVTCNVSEDCYRVVAAHPGWALWDAREITRRFRDLGAFKAGPILFTHFGPGWSEAFFGLSGDHPLIGAEARYSAQLREGTRFHHRLALIGREELLQQLDDFAEDEKARVLLLVGRGGLGKSRMLLEWSRRFREKHPDQTLRFISDRKADFGPALQVAPPPLMLVFDDAHRLDDVRRALFPELPHRPGIKVVLALRPGPTEQVMQELLGAGFDTTDIPPAISLKALTGNEAMQLVDTALKPQFLHLRHYLRAASRDCPLIAVLGAELINTGALVESDLRDADDVRRKVFESLLDDAKPARAEFGAQETDDFLSMIALLGPLKLDAAFFEKAAPFIGLASADRVSRLRDALDAAGLLLTTGAGTRVTPDLLSDHLAHDACYDGRGQSRSFAERLLETFSAEQFPKLMQHLAEAEWMAMSRNPDAASVVEPLWRWFRDRFERSPFHERREHLQQWANIAHLQPKRTLDLAELALSLTTAPEPSNEWIRADRWNSHANAITWLPRMLGPVAEHHPEFVDRCFDILWQLGKDDPAADTHNNHSHPLSVIHDVMTYKHWKRVDVHLAALDWIARLFAGEEWLRCANKPGAVFERFLNPLFATNIDVNWSAGRPVHFGSLPLHLENSGPVRERVRALCRGVLARQDPRLASQLIPTLEQGCGIARNLMGGEIAPAFRDTWDTERLKCLAILEEIARNFPEPLLHFQIRRVLMRALRYGKDSPSHRDACRRLVQALPDTLDFRIARAAFGTYFDEFERETDRRDWQSVAKAKWETFIRAVAEETHRVFPHHAWLEHFGALDTRWRAFESFLPNLRQLLSHIAAQLPGEGFAAAEYLLQNPNHPLANTFDAVAMSATKSNSQRRMEFIDAAATSDCETLRAAAVACCAWWRRDGDMPEAAWQILESLAPTATPLVADRLTNFVWWHDHQATLRDWNLVTVLPFTPQQVGLASSIAARAADLIEHGEVQPDAESVTRFIGRFEALKFVGGHELERAFERLAEAFPIPVFLTLWRRNEARKAGNTALESLPYDYHRILFRRVMDAPEVRTIVEGFERRALAGEPLDRDELRLLRRAIRDGENPSAWLEAAVARTTTAEHLEVLRQLGSVGAGENAALAYPDFVRALLQRARSISPACHEGLSRNLLHVGGGRGSTNNEPNDEWKHLLASIERHAHQYAADPELGPLFADMAKHERSWMDHTRFRRFNGDDEGM